MGDVPHHRDAKGSPGDRALAELARAQWGVVSLAQLRALGYGRGSVARRVERGRLHPLHRGVYAVGHRRLTRQGAYLAAVLACGPGAVLSHRSAAHYWGLLRSEAATVDVSVPRSRRSARPGIRLHRPLTLDAHDTTIHGGIPITTVPRTITDLPRHRRARALAQAERLRLDVGHHTSDPAHALTRSELEARFLELIDEAALPRPLVNLPSKPKTTDA